MLYRFNNRDLFRNLLRLGEMSREEKDGSLFCDVISIVDTGQLFGDRNKAAQLPPGVLWVRMADLVPMPEGEMKFSGRSDLGKYTANTAWERENLKVCLTVYENGCSVTVSDTSTGSFRTLFAKVFYGMTEETARGIIENGNIDEDVIFRLQEAEAK